VRRTSDDYLERLQQPGALTPVVGFAIPDRAEQALIAVEREMTGGTLLAARLARASGGIAVNLGGGFHHAHRDRGRGFCILNDVAVAIRAQRAAGFDGRILVVDLDLHDGDGTRSIFADDPTVHTCSIHNQNWDDRPADRSHGPAARPGNRRQALSSPPWRRPAAPFRALSPPSSCSTSAAPTRRPTTLSGTGK
jgi:acetoin utilization deacetylase AcuC-like enzyme